MTQLPPAGQGPIDPRGAFQPMPPPGINPPALPPRLPPVFGPAPKAPRARSRFFDAIVTAVATLIFAISLLLNVLLIMAVSSSNGEVKTRVLAEGSADDKIAVVPIHGIILGGQAEKFDRVMHHIEKDSAVKALIVEIDTPGGDVGASDTMYHRIMRFKTEKKIPVIISMGGMATSGGYYIACAGDYIVAQPTTLTANIGVLMPRLNLSKLIQKWGIDDSTLHSTGSDFKDAGSMLKPENPIETAYLQGLIDDAYKRFVTVVTAGRGSQIVSKNQTVAALADGKALFATDALGKGLVDQIGYLEDAAAYASTVAGVKKPTVVRFEERSSLFDIFSEKFGSNAREQSTVNGVNIDHQTVENLLTPHVMYLWTGQ